MATNYPGALDSLTNPAAGDALTSPSHSAQHANANDAIEAIETELGTTPSGSESTVAARLTAIESGARMGTGSIGATALADNAVDTNAIADGAATPAKLATTGRFVFPTGAANGYGFASGAVHLSGTGSPEGVITAAPGSTWLQTDATTDVKGWLRWIKSTGTGNTGWVVGPEADTGWRSITPNGAGWGSSGTLLVRRRGNTVSWSLDSLGTSGTTSPIDTAVAALTGWRPKASAYGGARNLGTGTYMQLVYNRAVNLTVTVAPTSGNTFMGSLDCLTDDAWPSSLPGTAA